MATTITFARGETTVTLPAPPGGYPVREVKRQAIGLTAGGTRYVYDKGIDTYEAEITLESLSDSEKASLDGFFHTTVDGSKQTFSYTDSAGDEYLARFLSPTLNYTKISKNCFDVVFHLELSAMAG